jgi:hypothetical protein
MTPEQLSEIKARLAKATPGEWFEVDGERVLISLTNYSRDAQGIVAEVYDPTMPEGTRQTKVTNANTEFIVHSRTDIEKLVAAYELKTQEVERLQEERRSISKTLILTEESEDTIRAEVERLSEVEKDGKALYQTYKMQRLQIKRLRAVNEIYQKALLHLQEAHRRLYERELGNEPYVTICHEYRWQLGQVIPHALAEGEKVMNE